MGPKGPTAAFSLSEEKVVTAWLAYSRPTPENPALLASLRPLLNRGGTAPAECSRRFTSWVACVRNWLRIFSNRTTLRPRDYRAEPWRKVERLATRVLMLRSPRDFRGDGRKTGREQCNENEGDSRDDSGWHVHLPERRGSRSVRYRARPSRSSKHAIAGCRTVRGKVATAQPAYASVCHKEGKSV